MTAPPALARRPLILVGTPNVGKSAIFGALTGRYATVSNYPGTTVETLRAEATLGGRAWEVIDTPGTDSLLPGSDDARVTRVGRWLRRTRIDELPQLVNVLKGEMSFVGPRPERPEFVAMLTEQIPYYAVRHSVKPGLTGWAQVRYSYGATVEQAVRKLEYDLYYVKNHTLVLDLVILLETVRVVLLAEGAR